MAQEYYSFEKVLKELQIEKEELNRLIEEGELTAVSAGDKIKFLASEVQDRKHQQMENATIVVGSGEDDELQPLEIQEEDEEFEDISEYSHNEEYQAESASSEEFVELGERFNEDKPLLDMSDKSAEAIPAGTEEVGLPELPEVAKKDKPDTEELIFEQSNEDELLDTGEVLFDSAISEVLPQDKEEAALFSDSEMGISGNYDDIDENKVKEAIDFLDNSEEEMVASGSSENKSAQKNKTLAGVSVAIIALFVIFTYMSVEPPKGNQEEKLALASTYKVESISVPVSYNYQSTLESSNQLDIQVDREAVIEELAPAGEVYQSGDVLVKLSYPAKEAELAIKQKQLAKIESAQEQFAQLRGEYGDLLKNRKEDLRKAYGTYKQYQRKHGNAAIAKMKQEKPEALKLLAQYNRLKKELSELQTYLKANQSQLEKLQEQIARLQEEAAGRITAAVEGYLDSWNVDVAESVNSGKKLGVMKVVDTLQASLKIPEKDYNNWGKGSELKVTVPELDGLEVSATVKSIHKDTQQVPERWNLNLEIENNQQQLLPGMTVEFSYTKNRKITAVPEQAIFQQGQENYYIYKIHDNTAIKKKILPGKKYPKDGQVFVSIGDQLLEGTEIVPSNELKVKDKQKVVMETQQ